ncbi:hypothetical protein [Iamia sp.]|uniref:hypothetical protein n=1 Tax=Iamia sp. TaxID=2722710 RepID=UPI002BB0CCDF|nr:hypothetical protein [Iamia sp.]HXH58430.1 hypothetical protein [Iamia sp.]
MKDAVEQRRTALRLSPGAFAIAAELTRQGVSPVRAGRRRQYEDATIFGVATALRWEPDWYDRLLRGEPPIELTAPVGQDEVTQLRADLSMLEGRVDELDRLIRAVAPKSTSGSAAKFSKPARSGKVSGRSVPSRPPAQVAAEGGDRKKQTTSNRSARPRNVPEEPEGP